MKKDKVCLPFMLSDNLASELDDKDKIYIRNIALKLKKADPKLDNTKNFGPLVRQGYHPGPVLFYEDHRTIALSKVTSSFHYQYRFLLLARQQDILLVENKRAPEYEKYCNDVLRLSPPETICLTMGEKHLPLARRCCENNDAMTRLADIARQNGCLNIMPYLSTGWTWALAQRIAERANVPVYVMAPSPRLSQKANDKLWFSERVVDCMGPRALPRTYYAFGPAALAIKVSRLAETHSCIVIKVPSSAGSMGNMVLDAAFIRDMALPDLKEYLLALVAFPGGHQIYPLAVSVWDSKVVTSPSLQIWIPLAETAPPIIEGVFEQALDPVTNSFIGAKPADLPGSLIEKLIQGGSMISYLFQQLGYYGRCSLDAVVMDKAGSHEIHWIECNARWGGVSIPMTAAHRLTGQWQEFLKIIVQSNQKNHISLHADFQKDTAGFHYDPSREKAGIVLLNPSQYEHVAYHDYMTLAREPTTAQCIFQSVDKISKQILQHHS